MKNTFVDIRNTNNTNNKNVHNFTENFSLSDFCFYGYCEGYYFFNICAEGYEISHATITLQMIVNVRGGKNVE